jgi:hypothetical protein
MLERILVAGGLLLAGSALAHSPGAHSPGAHSPGAHQHGVAELEVVLEGRRLAVELTGPLDNFAGFEHAPRNGAQRAALERALDVLRDPERVVALPAAGGCTLVASEIANPFVAGTGKAGHADLSASYQFDCAEPAALKRLELRLFETFPRLKKLGAAVAGPGGQKGAELTRARAGLSLVP